MVWAIVMARAKVFRNSFGATKSLYANVPGSMIVSEVNGLYGEAVGPQAKLSNVRGKFLLLNRRDPLKVFVDQSLLAGISLLLQSGFL